MRVLATDPGKAILRLLWDRFSSEKEAKVPLNRVAARLYELQEAPERGSATDPAYLDYLEDAARDLESEGYLVMRGRNGARQVELTQVGAWIARNVEIEGGIEG